jgi:cation transport ATPase
MDTQTVDPQLEVNKPKRSQLLTVLCILTFCMCGFSVVSGLIGLFFNSAESMQQNIESIRDINPETADQMENQLIFMQENAYAKIAPYLSLLYTLISLLGAIMMWNKNYRGLYIYSIAEILPYTAYIFMGQNSISMMSGGMPGMESIMMIAIVLMVIIDIVFVALYHKALKDSIQLGVYQS